MTITHRSWQAVVELLDRLKETYDEFDVLEKTWEREPAVHREIEARFESDAVGGAGVWFTNEAGEVLLVRNAGDDGWGDPGGKRETDETVEETARRELREETDTACRLTGVRDFQIIRQVASDRSRPEIFEAIVVFDGEYVGGDPRPQEGEIAEAGWFAAPPERVLYEEVRTRPYPASEAGR